MFAISSLVGNRLVSSSLVVSDTIHVKEPWNIMHACTCITLLLLAMAGSDANKLLREANDQFTAKLFSEAAKGSPDSSFVVSAFSVLTPLSLLSIASDGKTHEEILTTLGFKNDEAIKEAIPTVTSKLRSVKGIDIKMANRIYIPKGYELNDQFASTSRDIFQSEVKIADFIKSDKTVAEINGWVEAQTNNKIHDLVSKQQVNSDTRAILVNALYFKGLWDKPFNKALTKNGEFFKSKSDTTDVAYMYLKDNFDYAESDELNAKILAIPYQGKEASFLIILPKEVDGLDAVAAKLKDPAVLKKVTSQLNSVEVRVTIPKFKIESTTDLVEVLKKMGIEKIFNESAEITKLIKTKESLYVSSATQKAFIEVNEDGTEAAAANEFGIAYLSAFVPERVQAFKADHPFIFMVMQQDMILFSGVYKS